MKRELWYISSRAKNDPSKSRMWLASRRLATPGIIDGNKAVDMGIKKWQS